VRIEKKVVSEFMGIGYVRKKNYFRYFSFVTLIIFCFQLTNDGFSQQVSQEVQTFPLEILATRSIVLYDFSISAKEAGQAQKTFAKIGIDAEAYFRYDVVFSGYDPKVAFEKYFNSRQISYLVLFQKQAEVYKIGFCVFDSKIGIRDNPTEIYKIENRDLSDLLQTLSKDSWNSGQKKNFLINETPETDIFVNPINGKRQDYYPLDLKVDKLAVPKFGISEMDTLLVRFFKDNYPMKYEFVDSLTSDEKLRGQSFAYVLCYIHTQAIDIKKLLGYDLLKEEKGMYSSVTYPKGQLQVKTLPEETSVYKFYARHTNNGNIFVGPKWDADINWLDALENYILGFEVTANIR